MLQEAIVLPDPPDLPTPFAYLSGLYARNMEIRKELFGTFSWNFPAVAPSVSGAYSYAELEADLFFFRSFFSLLILYDISGHCRK